MTLFWLNITYGTAFGYKLKTYTSFFKKTNNHNNSCIAYFTTIYPSNVSRTETFLRKKEPFRRSNPAHQTPSPLGLNYNFVAIPNSRERKGPKKKLNRIMEKREGLIKHRLLLERERKTFYRVGARALLRTIRESGTFCLPF